MQKQILRRCGAAICTVESGIQVFVALVPWNNVRKVELEKYSPYQHMPLHTVWNQFDVYYWVCVFLYTPPHLCSPTYIFKDIKKVLKFHFVKKFVLNIRILYSIAFIIWSLIFLHFITTWEAVTAVAVWRWLPWVQVLLHPVTCFQSLLGGGR